ncbi:MAG TPA: hypothetical protein PK144_11240 [Plasticicumulans sp.]|nr:hypothetical protein [Plasticicumulans sp.]
MSMDKSMVLLKTVKGLDEIQNKVHGLAPKRRRVLIMVDGRMTVAEMLERLAALGSDLEAQLESLLSEGFLAPAGAASARAAPAPGAAPALKPAALDASPLPGQVEAVIPQFAEFNLDKAKGFARYVVLGALGPVGGKRAARIEQTRSAGELRAELDELRDVLPKLMPKRQAEQVWKQLEPLMLSITEAPSVSAMPQTLPP